MVCGGWVLVALGGSGKEEWLAIYLCCSNKRDSCLGRLASDTPQNPYPFRTPCDRSTMILWLRSGYAQNQSFDNKPMRTREIIHLLFLTFRKDSAAQENVQYPAIEDETYSFSHLPADESHPHTMSV